VDSSTSELAPFQPPAPPNVFASPASPPVTSPSHQSLSLNENKENKKKKNKKPFLLSLHDKIEAP
jgi:hypothetical protein